MVPYLIIALELFVLMRCVYVQMHVYQETTASVIDNEKLDLPTLAQQSSRVLGFWCKAHHEFAARALGRATLDRKFRLWDTCYHGWLHPTHCSGKGALGLEETSGKRSGVSQRGEIEKKNKLFL